MVDRLWNDAQRLVVEQRLVLPDPKLQPISVALPRVAETTEISLQMSALFLAVLIPVVLFLIFQKQFLRGVGMSGGIKE